MDNIYFNKFYYVPLLKELKQTLDNTNSITLTLSYINFLCVHIDIKTREQHINKVVINKKVYRSIYVHLEQTRKLYHELNKIDFSSADIKSPNKLFINNKTNKSVIDTIMKSKVPILANNFNKYINDSILKYENLIKQSINTDHDFVNLI